MDTLLHAISGKILVLKPVLISLPIDIPRAMEYLSSSLPIIPGPVASLCSKLAYYALTIKLYALAYTLC